MDTRLDPRPLRDTPSDDLEDYGGDFRNFEPLDGRTAAAIVKRRKAVAVPVARDSAVSQPAENPPAPQRPAVDPSRNREEGTVRLESAGRTLIAGDDREVVAACGRYLQPYLPCILFVAKPSAEAEADASEGADLLLGSDLRIRGGLGDFRATARLGGGPVELSRALPYAPGRFDLVLDLRPPAARDQVLPPPGYFAPDGPEALARDLEALPQMVGRFAKPRFVRLDAAACVGSEACDRCREVCPSAALARIGGALQIDHAACPGCGLCAAVCPTGALEYRLPTPQDLLVAVHGRIADARLESPVAPTVVFHQTAADESKPNAAPGTPEGSAPQDPVLEFPLPAIGGAGPEVWLAALAYGAGRVVLQLPAAYPAALRTALAGEYAWAAALLAALGHPRERLQLVEAGRSWDAARRMPRADLPAADFPPFQSKRTLIRRSGAHLAAGFAVPDGAADLPAGAPFGAVAVDSDACTLCLACCGVCPTGALAAPGKVPALHLLESECIQCGRCRSTCPEQALRLVPRLLFDPARAEKPRALWSQAPLACIRCGQPFAPPGLVAKLLERLEGHWMYRKEAERRRLRMCRDCRIIDLLSRPPGEEKR